MDIADRAETAISDANQRAIDEACQRAAAIPAGKPGDCDRCGAWSGRLVDSACAPCRDKWGLK